MVLDSTVFYAESGGQVGDRGTMTADGVRLAVVDTQKDASGAVYHHVVVEAGRVEVGAALTLAVDELLRRRTERNHTATHLLHASLRQRLGPGVRQAGSLVHPERLRFDFTFDRPLTEEDRDAIEDVVRDWVSRAVSTRIEERPYAEAIAHGAMALFGEKYGERVRSVEVPGFSLELCGGCHVRNTGEIGGFRIVSERGVASGVRRIEALSGDTAENLARQRASTAALDRGPALGAGGQGARRRSRRCENGCARPRRSSSAPGCARSRARTAARPRRPRSKESRCSRARWRRHRSGSSAAWPTCCASGSDPGWSCSAPARTRR